MKIIHIIRKPAIGGAEMLIKNIINSNDDFAFQHFIFHTASGPIIELIDPVKQEQVIFRKCSTRFFIIINLRKVIKKYQIDLIHTHQPIDSYISVIAAIGLKVKIIRTYHGYESIYNTNQKSSLKSRITSKVFNRYVAMNIFVSKDLLNYFSKKNPYQAKKTQHVLYNGIDTKVLLKQFKSDLRSELGISKDAKLAAMIGGFSTRGRDHLTVCKAMKMVCNQLPNLHFLFIGRTSGSEKLHLYVECYDYCVDNNLLSNVHFLGIRNDVGGILKDIDLYVHSSNNDTFGLALRKPCF
jgi:L-malate glycosyltransferase